MHCVPFVQPFLQACFSVTSVVPLYLLCLYIYVQYDMKQPRMIAIFARDPEHGPPYALGLPRRKFIELVSLLGVSAFFTSITLLLIYGPGVCARITRLYGRGQGILGSLVTACQWVPQIVLTWDIQVWDSYSTLHPD